MVAAIQRNCQLHICILYRLYRKKDKWVQEHFPGRIVWFELFGLSNKSIAKKVILVDGNPVIQLDNHSLVSEGKYADMEYQLEGMCKLGTFAQNWT